MTASGLEVLKWLQAHRTPAMDEFFLRITEGGESVWIWSVLAVVFWLFGARLAYRAGAALVLGDLLNTLVKNLVCMPRPWELDAAILPVKKAQWGAFGYSFPSGHTATTALLFGGLAAAARRWWVWVAALVWIGLMAASRLVLGVHTPLDVIGAVILAIPVVWGLGWAMERVEDRAAWAWWLAAGVALALGLAWVVMRYRPLLADEPWFFPRDTARAMWALLALGVAGYMERTYIRYEPERLGGYRLVAVGVGLVILILMSRHLVRLVGMYFEGDGAYYALTAAIPFWIFVVWPFLLQGLEKPVVLARKGGASKRR